MIPFTHPQNVERYEALIPRLHDLLFRLRYGNLALPASPVEQALARELVREARGVVSRDGFGKGLHALRHPELGTRAGILARLEEADTALAAFHALYWCEDYDDEEDGPYWRSAPEADRR